MAASVLANENDFATGIIGKKLSELGLTEEKVKEAMTISSNIEKRNVKGGPAKKEVARMIQKRRRDLGKDEKSREAKEESVKKSLEDLEKQIAGIIGVE